MANEVTLTWDTGQLGPFKGMGIEKAVVRALAKAGWSAIKGMKAAGTRSVRFRKRIRVKRVNDSLPLTFPKTTTDIDALEWRMDVAGDPIPMVDYPHRQVRRGVSVGINMGKRVLVKSAFIATMKSGHTGIFVRAKTGVHGPLTRGQTRHSDVFRVGRLPIAELYSSRVSDVFNDSGMIPAVQARAAKIFSSSFDRLLPIELAKMK